VAVASAQWWSQGLEVGWAQDIWGMEDPSSVQGQSPGGGLWAKPPEARYAYTICSGQTHFCDVFIENIRCTFRLMHSVLPLPPLLLQKNFEFVQISRPTLAEVGWARARLWLRHCISWAICDTHLTAFFRTTWVSRY